MIVSYTEIRMKIYTDVLFVKSQGIKVKQK